MHIHDRLFEIVSSYTPQYKPDLWIPNPAKIKKYQKTRQGEHQNVSLWKLFSSALHYGEQPPQRYREVRFLFDSNSDVSETWSGNVCICVIYFTIYSYSLYSLYCCLDLVTWFTMVYFLSPCRRRYVSTGFLCEKRRK